MGVTLRVSDAGSDRHVGRYASDVKLTWTAPGGCESASATINRPLDQFPTLGAADRLVAHADDGTPLWEGFCARPTPTEDAEGERFALSADGARVVASDGLAVLRYLSTDLDGFIRSSDLSTYKSPTLDLGTDPDTGKAVFTCGFPGGAPVANTFRARATEYSLIDAGLTIGAVRLSMVGGSDDSNYQMEAPMRDAANGFVYTGIADPLSTTPVTHTLFAGTGFDSSAASLSLQLRRVSGGETNVTTDNVWANFYDLSLSMARVDRYGNPAAVSSAVQVWPSEIVADLIGRMMPLVDPDASTIEVSAQKLERLAYEEPVTARQVLDDLLLACPDMLWEVGPSGPSGRFPFAFRAWPSLVRYEITEDDSPTIQGDDAGDLCNRVMVRYTDAQGRSQSVTVSAVVPPLDDEGRVRYMDPIDLPDGMGTEALAQTVGTASLAARNAPPTSGTATVSRRIVDLYSGESVEPYFVRPGFLVRRRDTGTVSRLTEVTYDADSGSSDLTYGTPPRTPDQIVADVAARNRR